MKDLVILFLVLLGLIVMLVIIFVEIVETWGDLRESDRIKKKTHENNSKEFLGFLDDNDGVLKAFHSFLHTKLTDNVIEFRERWEREGRIVTENDELAFREGFESGVDVMMHLLG